MNKTEHLSRSTGQLFMVGLPDKTLDKATRRLIQEEYVGNFILFRRNVQDPLKLWRLCRDLQDACAANLMPPPLIAIDQEGGSVTRLPPPFPQFSSARDRVTAPDPQLEIVSYSRRCAADLTLMGINMNFAPVLDVATEGEGYYMTDRTLGSNPALVAELGALTIKELEAHGVAACAKHFPGLGAAREDPHSRLPVISRAREALLAIDLLPFRAAISVGVAAMMTSHSIYTALDCDHPATFSASILTDLLRKECGYAGLLITDDLEMGAIDQADGLAGAGLSSFLAGADLLLICHDQEKAVGAKTMIMKACIDGQIPEERFGESLSRLAAVKRRFPFLRPDEEKVRQRFT